MTVHPSWVTTLESFQGHCPRVDLALRRNKDRAE
jgi:hypothetical protein